MPCVFSFRGVRSDEIFSQGRCRLLGANVVETGYICNMDVVVIDEVLCNPSGRDVSPSRADSSAFRWRLSVAQTRRRMQHRGVGGDVPNIYCGSVRADGAAGRSCVVYSGRAARHGAMCLTGDVPRTPQTTCQPQRAAPSTMSCRTNIELPARVRRWPQPQSRCHTLALSGHLAIGTHEPCVWRLRSLYIPHRCTAATSRLLSPPSPAGNPVYHPCLYVLLRAGLIALHQFDGTRRHQHLGARSQDLFCSASSVVSSRQSGGCRSDDVFRSHVST